MVKPQGPDNENREERKEKFDVTLEDDSPGNTGGLNIRLEDLPPETNVRSASGNPVQARQGRSVQLVYCQQCGRGSQVGFKYCPNCATALVAQSGARVGRGFRQVLRKPLFIVSIILLVVIIIAVALLYTFGIMPFGSNDRTISVMVPDDYSSIQDAINDAEDGWEIVVKPGIYYENINFRGKAVILRSENPGGEDIIRGTIIDGGRQGPVVVFNTGEGEGTTLSGFTIRGGSGLREYVEAIDVDQAIYSGYFGGGIFISSGSYPQIENNYIIDNLADYGGGIAIIDASPTLINNEVLNNLATISGGGLFILNAPSTVAKENYIKSNRSAGGEVWIDSLDLLDMIKESNEIEGFEPEQDDD